MKRPDFGYWRFMLRVWWPGRVRWWFRETLPRRCAYLIPRKVALFVFIRVYSVLDYCGADYVVASKLWEAGEGR